MIEITSRDNPKLKQIRKIRDGHDSGFIFVEGLRLSREALRSPVTIAVAVFARSFGENSEFESIAETIIVPDKIFGSIADTKNPQGVILIAERPATDRKAFEERFDGGTSVLLHRVNNPSNLGAILRTCEAAGINNVIVTRDSADVFSPKALRASMGSAFRLNIGERADFGLTVRWARKIGLRTTAADISGAVDYRQLETGKRLIVFGSEANGLTEEELADMDDVVVIPMRNGVESLNLAVSAGIILFASNA